MLIGRVAEQRALTQLAASARVARSATLVLVGEAGIGKSALLADLATHAEGLRVLRVRGSETERDLAFGGLDQLVRPLLGLLADIPPPQARALEVALALAPEPHAGTPPADRFAISAATLSLLGRAAEDHPTLVLVDDAHALDRPSAEALVFTARRILADPLALVAATRPSDRVLLQAGLPRLDVAGLSAEDVARLLAQRIGAPVPTEVSGRVHDATAGNPLAVLELATSLDRVEQLSPATPLAVPGRVADEYARRVATLGDRTRVALLVASITGDQDRPEAVAERLGVGLDDLAPAESAGLVDLRPGRVDFRHPLARAGAYAAASPEQQRTAHLAVAAVTSDPDRRAWHRAEGTLGFDDGVARELADTATRSRSRGAHAVAASAFERAAALTTPREERADRLLAAGEEAALAGHGARARALLDRAATATGDRLMRARADALRAAVEQRWGSLERSRDLAGRALVPLVDADPDAAVDTAADLVTTCLYLGDADLAGRTATLLDQLAARASEPARIRALLSGGVARVLAGGSGIDRIREAMASMVPGPPWRDELRLSWLVAGPLFAREGAGPSRDLADQALHRLRETSAIGSLSSLLFHVAKYAASTDRWAEAAGHYREGIPLARETGQSADLTQLLAGLAWLEARTGEEERCREHAAEALALAARHHVHLGRIWATYALGDLELGRGRPDAALVHYGDLQAFLDRLGFRDVDVCPAPEVAECLQRTGRDAEATRLAVGYRSRALAKGQAWALARAERAVAGVAPDPRPGLERALALHATTPDLFEEARTRMMLGEFERRERHRSVARDLLGTAVGAFDDLGARPWADRAARELAATGARVHRRADHSLDLLTPQEVQVAQLLAGGRTTRQAAAAMFLSPKTVEYHLRHVYTKLGINNRADLADALGGTGSGRPLRP